MRVVVAFAIAVGIVVAAACGGVARAAPTTEEAERLFADAALVCKRDGARLWGRSLCGPLLLVDGKDRAVIANAADLGGALRRSGDLYVGTLPDDVLVANTSTDWGGLRWTQLDSPIPDEADRRRVLIAHELFHRIQPALGLTRPEAPNLHLDTFEGRYLLQLEWRALAAALKESPFAERRAAVADALAFRRERYRLVPQAAEEESALEINEGIAEYTGVVVGLATPRERIDYAVRDLSAFVAAPTFVRSFAYATGPAYGLLLDANDRLWRSKIAGGRRLDQLLGDALRVNPAADVMARARVYDADGSLRAAEETREGERQVRLAQLKARFVDGPVLTLPLVHMNFQFNPQTLIGFDGYGAVYPTMRLVDDWGSLEVESGGALVAARVATVGARGFDRKRLIGDGWKLTLRPGWTVRSGSRPGDLVVACDGKCPR